MFFIPRNNWKTLFLIKVYHYLEIIFNNNVLVLFETSDLKEVRYFLSPQYITKVKVQCKHTEVRKRGFHILCLSNSLN